MPASFAAKAAPTGSDPRRGGIVGWRGFSAGAALLLAWISAPVFGGDPGLPAPLAPFEAQYELGNGSIRVGSATVRLRQDPRGWRYESATKAEGLFALLIDGPVRDTTWLEVHDGALRPLEYRHQEEDDEVRVTFDWGQGQARVDAGGEVRRVDLEPATRDQFSAMLAVIRALAAGERSVSFPGIDDEGERERLRFEMTGKERLTVPLASYDTVRVERMRDDKRSTVTWLAPALDWLPVRVEQRKKGDLVARLDLTALDGEEAPSRTQRRRR